MSRPAPHTIKQMIVASSIEQDQQRVASQWLNTFKYNRHDDAATTMIKCLLACIAKGDFSISTAANQPNQTSRPSTVLSIVDYLSHASRIIIDYQQLSAEHQQQLLAIFAIKDNGAFSRTSTHAVARDIETSNAKELKGFMLGLKGMLPGAVKTPQDFGINIAMGGEGQLNFVGKTITNNGYSGHFYFNRNDDEQLLMAGLEQSTPVTNLSSLLFHGARQEDGLQDGIDQFDQAHSMKGASDTFTAAGSLYFSDPVYQAKLLTEKGALVPNKYNGMIVQLTDENWPAIKAFIETLNSDALQLEQLLQAPSTAVTQTYPITDYLSFDFAKYLQRILILLPAGDESQKLLMQQKHDQLLSCLHDFQAGRIDKLEQFNTLISEINSDPLLAEDYKKGIVRLQWLVEQQLALNPDLKNIHTRAVIIEKSEALLFDITETLSTIDKLNTLFDKTFIEKDAAVATFLQTIQEHKERLLQTKQKLEVFISMPLADELATEALLSQLEMLDEIDEQLKLVYQDLNQPPKLSSHAALCLEKQKLARTTADLQSVTEQLAQVQAEKEMAEQALLQVKHQYQGEQQQQVMRLSDENSSLKVERDQLQLLLNKQKLQAVFQPLQQKLASLINKAEQDFDDDSLAAQTARQLVDDVEQLMDEFNYQNPQQSLADFQQQAQVLVNTAEQTLSSHRGWDQTLNELLLCIATLVIPYVICATVKGLYSGNFTFFNQGRVQQEVSEVAAQLEQLFNIPHI